MQIVIRLAAPFVLFSVAAVHPAYSQPETESAEDSELIQIERCGYIDSEEAEDMTTAVWRLRLMDQIDCLQRQNRHLVSVIRDRMQRSIFGRRHRVEPNVVYEAETDGLVHVYTGGSSPPAVAHTYTGRRDDKDGGQNYIAILGLL